MSKNSCDKPKISASKSALFSNINIWLGAVLVLVFLLSLRIGRMEISFAEIGEIILSQLGLTSLPAELSSKETVFVLIRLPRCLLALLVGMGLSLAGAVFQALFRNPLISPDILGVSSGCMFGAALGLMLPLSTLGTVQFISLIFGVAAVLMAYGVARIVAYRPIITLILTGIVISSVFNAMLMCLKYMADPYNELPAIVFWIMGSLSRASWLEVGVISVVVIIGIVVIFFQRFRLNILSLGDIQARSMGINPVLYRVLFITLGALIVAVVVSTCGQVGWVSLVVPHIARSMVGPNHIRMIPVTALLGGIFLLLADTLARSITAAELPVSIITALVGAPVFAFLLYKKRGSGWV